MPLQQRNLFLHFWRRRFCSTTKNAKIDESNSTRPKLITRTPTNLFRCQTKIPFSVEPDLDFRRRLENLDSLERLLKSRGCVDIEKSFGDLSSLSEKYFEWRRVYADFVRKYPRQLVDEIVLDTTSDEFRTFNDFRDSVDRLERDCILTCLRIPADLHSWTPIGDRGKRLSIFAGGREIDTDQVPRIDNRRMQEIDISPSAEIGSSSLSHMEIISSIDPRRSDIEFKNDPPQCFLVGGAARLLQTLEKYFLDRLLSIDYRPLSPAHFVRTAMVEAYYGRDIDEETNTPYVLPVETISGSKGEDTSWALNLAGHGVLPYLALFARKGLGRKNAFPLKFCSHGMAYGGKIDYRFSDDDQSIIDQGGWNLFNFPIQRPKITAWIMFEEDDESEISENITKTIRDLLSNLNLSFTIDQQSSYRLLFSEMSRVDISAPKSIRLASISNYGDFLSKRVRLMSYMDANPGGQKPRLEDKYVKCAYAEIDLYNVLARIYEELYPKSIDQRSDRDIDWWPDELRSLV